VPPPIIILGKLQKLDVELIWIMQVFKRGKTIYSDLASS